MHKLYNIKYQILRYDLKFQVLFLNFGLIILTNNLSRTSFVSFRDVRGNDVARKEGGGFRHQEASGADLDDKWRRDDPPPPISHNSRDKPSGGFRESRSQDTWRGPRDDSASGGYKNDYDFRGPPRDYGPPREGRGGVSGGGGGYRDSREGFKSDGRGGAWRNRDTRDEQLSSEGECSCFSLPKS